MFHSALNDCIVKDNRIPPLGFVPNAETAPVAYTYPENPARPGTLLNEDLSVYTVTVPSALVGPLLVEASMLYQTTSKEYVDFLRDENVSTCDPFDEGCDPTVEDDRLNRGEKMPGLPVREWLHRPSFELGRHLLGYELQKVLAGVDCLRNTQGSSRRKIGVVGWGEGGLLSLYAAALDTRIDAACVAGYFGEREALWKEPAEHNVFGLLREFGDAEIASLIDPRPLMLLKGIPPAAGFALDAAGEPERLEVRPKRKGKPGKFIGGYRFEQELQRLRNLPIEEDLHAPPEAEPGLSEHS